jgi:hypothetical protein
LKVAKEIKESMGEGRAIFKAAKRAKQEKIAQRKADIAKQKRLASANV